jgi:hypothetical protein
VKRGFLSQYFDAVAAKRLTAVEADTLRSNQHEFNGTEELKRILGTGNGKTGKRLPAKFAYLTDTEDEAVADEGPDCFLTWYDARAKSASRTGRSEYRLYFPTTRVSQCSAEGDLLILGRREDETLFVFVAERDSTVASQLVWLFGLGEIKGTKFALRDDLQSERHKIGFAERLVLEQIGIEVVDEQASDFVEHMLRTFRRSFPSTKTFSEYARSTLRDVVSRDDPDNALMTWMEREELLFRALERVLVSERLARGFSGDVDKFIKFSSGVHNRRKSRAGWALEHHLSKIFDDCDVRYSRHVATEGKSKPDFVFPGIVPYRQARFPPKRLTMLGAKTTCKDRWRQVLTEAARIKRKHLLTLEAAISEHQTREMERHNLQLVLPKPLHKTYKPNQQRWLMTLRDFVGLVRVRAYGPS